MNDNHGICEVRVQGQRQKRDKEVKTTTSLLHLVLKYIKNQAEEMTARQLNPPCSTRVGQIRD